MTRCGSRCSSASSSSRWRAPTTRSRSWTPPAAARRRALFVSSAIGLGHALRDVAIADELRALHPDLEIDWLAQDPVTRLLADRGERVHPASRFLASESAHIESEAGEHDLHAFQAIRRMDEILAANFHVFHDVVEDEQHDLVVADEGWEIDHFLHENPELKRTAYAWLTDFVGWLPMTDGGPREAALTADYNAEMVEQIARYPRLRDRSIFVGDPDDLVTDPLGPGLPTVRDWTRAHYAFAGYVTGFTPVDRAAARAELGFQPDEPVCVVAVGGSGVGGPLLRRVVAAHPYAAKRVPGLRTVVVTGPRIDPATVPAPAGVEVRGYVPGLLPAARRLRRRGRPRRADDDDGADGAAPPVPVLPAAPPLRAADPRRAPARPSPGGHAHALRHRDTRVDRRGPCGRAGPAGGVPAGAHRRCPARSGADR